VTQRVLVAMLLSGTAWTSCAERACCCRRFMSVVGEQRTAIVRSEYFGF
jgi:hypothetical protein